MIADAGAVSSVNSWLSGDTMYRLSRGVRDGDDSEEGEELAEKGEEMGEARAASREPPLSGVNTSASIDNTGDAADARTLPAADAFRRARA